MNFKPKAISTVILWFVGVSIGAAHIGILGHLLKPTHGHGYCSTCCAGLRKNFAT